MQKLTWILHLIVSYSARLRADLEPKIVGGVDADIIDHPHSAFLHIECVINGARRSWQCSASIINQQILLTAAHCLYECTSNFRIVATVGSQYYYYGLRNRIHSHRPHAMYDPKSTSNDIALLKTYQPFNLSNKVSRVALMRNPPYFEQGQIAGWGYIDDKIKETSSKLQYINQKWISRRICMSKIGNIPEGTFCAVSDSHKKYAAKGDSGSALVVRGYIQLGILSFRRPDISIYTSVYTDVAKFYDWIEYRAPMLMCWKKT